ncbi:MerR family DNA-binding transcriptional regulator (plasmid) [Streptomyces sp. P8-A8]|uniref:MerR family DNA-binding transcriptional regulator n=1 Tax=Streptomyces sp. P8-A8 TaxID=3029759 RepID=UPI0036DB7CF7
MPSAAGSCRPATPAPLRQGRNAIPVTPTGGDRRYSRYQLRIAARARELVDQGTAIEAACRVVILEDQLEEAQRPWRVRRSRSAVRAWVMLIRGLDPRPGS